MRTLLRTGPYVASYRGIFQGPSAWNVLSAPKDSILSWVQMVDSVALATAAFTEISDPCVEVEGELFPTAVSSVSQKLVNTGFTVPNVPDDAPPPARAGYDEDGPSGHNASEKQQRSRRAISVLCYRRKKFSEGFAIALARTLNCT